MEAWARERGLDFVPDGLLPAWTPTLAQGLGRGAHRAGLVIARGRHSVTSVGGLTKYPERASHDLCRGTLPGGLEGVVAHHLHLDLHGASDGESWKAFPDTVVVARLPAGARVVQELTIRAGAWQVEPAEDPALLATLRTPQVEAALAAVPDDTTLEYRYGGLCVASPHAVTDAAVLDALCRLAAAFGVAMEGAAALLPALDPDTPLPPPAEDERARWLAEGVARVQWSRPPASVPEAAAAYGQMLGEEAAASGSSVRRIAMAAALVLAVLGLAAIAALGAFFGWPAALGALIVVGPLFVFRLLRGAWRTGAEASADHLAARTTPWGLEAFARGYAAERGMVLEDRDAFRRRFDSPVPGVPLKVLRGGGRRLVLWLDTSDLAAKRHVLIGIGPAGVVHHQVDDAGRSVANLDRLAAEVGSQEALSSA